jgi:hypothetical protein
MSLVISHLDAFPEPQEGEATVSLSLTVAQPQRRGDAEGWRARATCVESGRVLGRWMSDCPLSVAQSALLWLGMYPWEVLPEDGGFDYADIIDQADRPASNDQIHVRELLERIATNLPPKPSEVVNPVTGARVLRRPPKALLPVREEVEEVEEEDEDEDEDVDSDGPEGTPEWGDVPDEDEEGEDEDEVEEEPAPVRRARAKPAPAPAPRAPRAPEPRVEKPVDGNQLLRRAVALLQDGDDPARLARALEKRGGRSLAETFLALSGQIARPAPAPAPAPPRLSPEAEEEIARYAVGDETAVRAKLDRTAQRAAREHARVEAFLANKARLEAEKAARASHPSLAPNMITLKVHPTPAPAQEPVAVEPESAPTKPRRGGRKKAEVVSVEEAG